MQKFKTEILLLDDERASLDFSRQAISQFVPESLIYTAQTVEEALEILQARQIQMAFLDVELTHNDGFTLCQYIHRKYPLVKVVILTGHVDLGAKSYDYEPFDFLVKPVDVLRLERTFHRFQEEQSRGLSPRIVIETNAGLVLLSPQDILYISKSGNTCLVHCQHGLEYRVNCTLDRLEKTLEGQGFFRTHQSFLVPVVRIQQVRTAKFGTSYDACLDDGSVVPVSRSKYAALKEFILQRSVHL